jgi:Winged helix DNA-binding domain
VSTPLTLLTLNRTLLERQLLLRRHRIGIPEAMEHLVGLQAQAPLAPYVGLWDRVAGFNAEDLSDLLTSRQAVRSHLMRVTIHLVTAPDCRVLRPLMQSMIARSLEATDFARDLVGVDRDALAAAAHGFMAERALTRPELGRLLAATWPDRDPGSLATAATYLVPAVQVPPRGLWKSTGPVAWATVDSWLDREGDVSPVTPEELMLRYLAAYGPASVADMRTWSRLPGLAEVVDRIRPRLRRYRDPRGRELLDGPEGTICDPDTSAPPRFLPEYDNVLLSHADRSRINRDGHHLVWPAGNGASMGNLLVDGFFRGTWRIDTPGDAATLNITVFDRLPKRSADQVVAEGHRLLAFAAAERSDRDVRIAVPQ